MPIINNIMIFVHGFAHKKLKKKIFKLFWFKGCLWPRKCNYIYMQLLEPINLTKMYKVLRSILKLTRMMLLTLMISFAIAYFDKSGQWIRNYVRKEEWLHNIFKVRWKTCYKVKVNARSACVIMLSILILIDVTTYFPCRM